MKLPENYRDTTVYLVTQHWDLGDKTQKMMSALTEAAPGMIVADFTLNDIWRKLNRDTQQALIDYMRVPEEEEATARLRVINEGGPMPQRQLPRWKRWLMDRLFGRFRWL